VIKVESVDLRRTGLRLQAPFRTSFGVETERDILLLRVATSAGEGWGDCVAEGTPPYSSESVDGAQAVLRDHLLPRLLAADLSGAQGVAQVLVPVAGHRRAKAAIEMAVLDAELRGRGESLATRLGAVRPAVDKVAR
jgi:O-succinylbenzoate synthase